MVFFCQTQDLKNKKVLITAGPTYESLDPVRFIGNHSSGKMGLALAEHCVERGAEVHLVLGPNALKINNNSINVIDVQSGEQMYNACLEKHRHCDIVIFAAAVADYKPKTSSLQKIKKSSDSMNIELVKTIDIAATLGQQKSQNQIHVGFALETTDGEAYALKKIEKKNFDFIVLNSLKDKGAGFKHDTNKVTILTDKGEKTAFPLKSKKEVAVDIVNTLVKNYVT